MTRSHPTVRAVRVLALLSAAGAAAAHTGHHGHEGMSFWQGVAHALLEPDHLLMLGAGAVICTLAAPRVLRLLARLRVRLAGRRAPRPGERRT